MAEPHQVGTKYFVSHLKKLMWQIFRRKLNKFHQSQKVEKEGFNFLLSRQDGCGNCLPFRVNLASIVHTINIENSSFLLNYSEENWQNVTLLG